VPECLQQRGVPTPVAGLFSCANDSELGGHGAKVLVRDAELEKKLLPFVIALCLQEQREGVCVRVRSQHRRDVGGDLASQSVLPILSVEVVEENGRPTRCRGLEEQLACRPGSESYDVVNAGDARMDDEILNLADNQPLESLRAVPELLTVKGEGLASQAVVHQDRQ